MPAAATGTIALMTLALPGSMMRSGSVTRPAAASTTAAEAWRLAGCAARRAHPPPAASAMRTFVAFELAAAAAAARLTNREVGKFSLRNLTLGTRKRGADQATMDGALVIGWRGRHLTLAALVRGSQFGRRRLS
jgi:hypothetical protein